MGFTQTCMVCKKVSVTGGSDIGAGVAIQFRAFIKTIESKGWQVLFVGEKEMRSICPFCNRRVIKELEKRASGQEIKKENKNGKICRIKV